MAVRPDTTLGIALLMVIAGCSGLIPGPDDPTTSTTSRLPYDVPDPTETSAGTTERVTPVASPSFRDAVANHTAALRTGGRFVVRERIETNTRRTPFTRSFAADLAADRYWWHVPSDPADGVYDEGAIYQQGTEIYQRTETTNATPFYRRVSRPSVQTPRNVTFQLIRSIPNVSVFFPFERNGTATFEGEVMARYGIRTQCFWVHRHHGHARKFAEYNRLPGNCARRRPGHPSKVRVPPRRIPLYGGSPFGTGRENNFRGGDCYR